jgi:hypothetical protein
LVDKNLIEELMKKAEFVETAKMSENLESPYKIHNFGVPGSATPIDRDLWSHPMLAFYQEPKPIEVPNIPTKLYLIPTPEYFGRDVEDYSDPEFLAKPSPLSELPEIEEWVTKFTLGVVEIWGGRRSANQLARWCHRQVHQQLLVKPMAIKVAPKIRKIYISEPIEGVAETTVTLRIGERVRSLILRFEGVDKRWLCTELVLL